MERHISKEGLISIVMDLNGIINNISTENCYGMVVKFFGLTSTLEDNLFEIGDLPMKGKKVFGVKSAARKKAEADRAFFIKEVKKAGRNLDGINRTEPQEPPTKYNIYFGNIDGIKTLPVVEFENCKDDDYVQPRIRWQIVDFVKSYKDSFKLDWLR